MATDHESNLTSVTNNTDIYTLLGGNSTCVLQAEVTEGPYCKSRDVWLLILEFDHMAII